MESTEDHLGIRKGCWLRWRGEGIRVKDIWRARYITINVCVASFSNKVIWKCYPHSIIVAHMIHLLTKIRDIRYNSLTSATISSGLAPAYWVWKLLWNYAGVRWPQPKHAGQSVKTFPKNGDDTGAEVNNGLFGRFELFILIMSSSIIDSAQCEADLADTR